MRIWSPEVVCTGAWKEIVKAGTSKELELCHELHSFCQFKNTQADLTSNRENTGPLYCHSSGEYLYCYCQPSWYWDQMLLEFSLIMSFCNGINTI